MKKKIWLLVFMIFIKSVGILAQDVLYTQESPVLVTLYSVYFVDNNTGWIVGGNGTILHTDNKGKIWNQQSYDKTYDLHSICFINESTGWIVGSHGIILKTIKGGTDWVEQNVGISDTSFFDVFFVNDSTGWIVGRYGTIFNTSDGGDNWSYQSSNTQELLLSIYFINQDIGWIVGDRTILKTINGGIDWVPQDSETNDSFKSVYFVNADTGWVVGGWNGATILKTKDGGENWTIENSGFSDNLRSIYFINDSTAWIVGEKGTIFKTITQGASWTQQESHTSISTLRSIYFTDINSGWVVGENGIILSTINVNSTGIEEADNFHPDRMVLMQNYPNPFNPSTVIHFYLHQSGSVTLSIYNIRGEEIETLLQDYYQAGQHEVFWNAEDFPSGIYLISLRSGNFSETKKIILQK